MTKRDPEEERLRRERLAARVREAEEVFERQGARTAARRRAEEARQERRRSLVRLLTFGRAA
jgi:hypothetical protein